MDLATYTSGRLFHIYGELRWERQRDFIHVVYTGDPGCLPSFAKEQEEALSNCKVVTRRYFLFGKKFDRPDLGAEPGDFAEVRIPRLLRYPALPGLANARYLKLATCEYLDPRTGANVAYRFKKLVPGK